MPETQNKNKFIRLLNYSGNYKYLTIIGMFLSALSAICLLVPFIYIWDVVNALLAVAPDFTKAQNLDVYAINAFTFAILGIILNFFGLMGTHLSAFKNEKNMKDAAINHLLKLPLGYFSNHTSGGLRKIIDYSTAKTEVFLAHQLFDLTGAIVTPIVFLILLFSFDWLLGLICLIPIILCFVFMYPMFSKESRNSMEKYEKYLEEMNGEAVEYVRGIPVTKAFQQSIYSFKNFINAIKNYRIFYVNSHSDDGIYSIHQRIFCIVNSCRNTTCRISCRCKILCKLHVLHYFHTNLRCNDDENNDSFTGLDVGKLCFRQYRGYSK